MPAPIFPALVALVAGAVALGGAVVRMQGHGQLVRDRLQRAVGPLGLGVAVSSLGTVAQSAGEVDGIALHIRYVEPHPSPKDKSLVPPRARLSLELLPPVPLPAGLRVSSMGLVGGLATLLGGQDILLGRPELDERLRIQGEDPAAIRALLGQPALREALTSCALHALIELQLDDQGLRIELQQPQSIDAEVPLRLGLRLARALVDAVERPWKDLAARLHLRMDGGQGGSSRILAGSVDGIDLKITLSQATEELGPQTRIHAAIRPALPGGARLRGRPRGAAASGVGTGNPVFDGLIELQAADPGPARALLQREELQGPLLELLNDHPGALIHPRGVVVQTPGWLGAELGPLVDQALTLARLLSEGRGAP